MPQRKLWIPQQDKILKYLREVEKIKKWSIISTRMQEDYNITGRSGKQCRERYHNHLDSSISAAQWTPQQQKILFEMHEQNGNKWTLMMSKLKGRTENCIKNHFYSKVRKSQRKINKLIHDKFKIQYKQIKTSLLYKLLEVAQSKFKPSSCSFDNQMIQLCANIKNRLYIYEDQCLNINPFKQDELTRAIIRDIQEFQKTLKKQKKNVKSLNMSGQSLLHPRLKNKRSGSFQSQDISQSLYSSSSYNSSFNPSQDLSGQDIDGYFLNQNTKYYTQSLKVHRTNSESQKLSKNWDINSLRISDIQKRQNSQCLSDLCEYVEEQFIFDENQQKEAENPFLYQNFNQQKILQEANFEFAGNMMEEQQMSGKMYFEDIKYSIGIISPKVSNKGSDSD